MDGVRFRPLTVSPDISAVPSAEGREQYSPTDSTKRGSPVKQQLQVLLLTNSANASGRDTPADVARLVQKLAAETVFTELNPKSAERFGAKVDTVGEAGR